MSRHSCHTQYDLGVNEFVGFRNVAGQQVSNPDSQESLEHIYQQDDESCFFAEYPHGIGSPGIFTAIFPYIRLVKYPANPYSCRH